ncbi:MAG TPA: hypothetical protein VJ824_16400 [Bacillota bacterium]|nr:hypothetical protein [Bacillota bacterium]
MITIRSAKSHMENEEGMNHLWIKIIPPEELTEQTCIHIDLPKGVQRLPNVNGYKENEQGWIYIDEITFQHDLLIEIYTTSSIECGDSTIFAQVVFKQQNQEDIVMDSSLCLPIVSEESMDQLVVDEEVVSLVKRKLAERSEGDTVKGKERDYVVIHPKLYELSIEMTELEKKYRITF